MVAIDVDPLTCAYARENLRQAGYADVILVPVTAGSAVPSTNLTPGSPSRQHAHRYPRHCWKSWHGGQLIAPAIEDDVQDLVAPERTAAGVSTQIVCQVLYVCLRGIYGATGS